jgi:hypothetical protein
MTEITAKPFDWNDNLSEEALEDFEGIQKDLPYCTCQNIGMALAKLELLEKQGCKVIDPSGSSSEKQKPKSEWEHDHEILKAYSDGANEVLESIKNLIEQYEHYLELLDADMKDGSATIVTKTKYAVYTEVVKQLKEVLESEDKA